MIFKRKAVLTPAKITSILVVCMGNICRSPTGEAVLRTKLAQAKLAVSVDSAGTTGSHKGERPDPRAKKAGEARAYSFKGLKGRKVSASDFSKFDLILAADRQNLDDLQKQCPFEHQHKLHLFLEYGKLTEQEIPDPYYGSVNGFSTVLDLIEEASDAIIRRIR